jgi:hypothetical protein
MTSAPFTLRKVAHKHVENGCARRPQVAAVFLACPVARQPQLCCLPSEFAPLSLA